MSGHAAPGASSSAARLRSLGHSGSPTSANGFFDEGSASSPLTSTMTRPPSKTPRFRAASLWLLGALGTTACVGEVGTVPNPGTGNGMTGSFPTTPVLTGTGGAATPAPVATGTGGAEPGGTQRGGMGGTGGTGAGLAGTGATAGGGTAGTGASGIGMTSTGDPARPAWLARGALELRERALLERPGASVPAGEPDLPTLAHPMPAPRMVQRRPMPAARPRSRPSMPTCSLPTVPVVNATTREPSTASASRANRKRTPRSARKRSQARPRARRFTPSSVSVECRPAAACQPTSWPSSPIGSTRARQTTNPTVPATLEVAAGAARLRINPGERGNRPARPRRSPAARVAS